MSDIEIALYIWGLSNVFWILINAFMIEERISPKDMFLTFIIGISFSPIFAIAVMVVVYRDLIHDNLFKER